MISITKIFRFEMAHAVHGYPGKCSHVHGHSYQLDVTIALVDNQDTYFDAPGFVIDFKDLKQIVNEAVVHTLDHCLVLSKHYLLANPAFATAKNLQVWEYEPTAENILIYIKNNVQEKLPVNLQLVKLKLYETNDSYAEWQKP